MFDAKRLIGRQFNDPTVQNDALHWPFLVKDEGGKPVVEVQFQGKTKRFKPEEISAMASHTAKLAGWLRLMERRQQTDVALMCSHVCRCWAR